MNNLISEQIFTNGHLGAQYSDYSEEVTKEEGDPKANVGLARRRSGSSTKIPFCSRNLYWSIASYIYSQIRVNAIARMAIGAFNHRSVGTELDCYECPFIINQRSCGMHNHRDGNSRGESYTLRRISQRLPSIDYKISERSPDKVKRRIN